MVIFYSCEIEIIYNFTKIKLHSLFTMLTAELNRSRRIGCEFEMTMPLVGSGSGSDIQHTLARVLSSNGLSAVSRSYSHSRLPSGADLAVEYDSSVTGESKFNGITWFPIEVKTRILNGIDDFEQIVPKTLEICRYMGARVNRSCGFHLHIELTEILTKPTVIKSLFNLFHRFEPVIYGLVAPSRINSEYAKPIPSDSSKILQGCWSQRSFRSKLQGWDRKSGLNLTHILSANHFSSTPRVEFRYHQGTLDVEKARYWTRFLLQMTEHACRRNCHSSVKQVRNTRQGLEKLLITGFKVNTGIYSKVAPELRETGKYLINRWKKFNGNISLKASKLPGT